MERQREQVGTLNGRNGMAKGLVAGMTRLSREAGKLVLELT